MVQHAQADNVRLLKAYRKVCSGRDPPPASHAACSSSFAPRTLTRSMPPPTQVLAKEKGANWNLKALKYYYIPVPPNGIARGLIQPTDDLLRLQQGLFDAVPPFAQKSGTADAFVSTDRGARHPGRKDRLRRQFHHSRSRQEIQSARHNWRRSRSIS